MDYKKLVAAIILRRATCLALSLKERLWQVSVATSEQGATLIIRLTMQLYGNYQLLGTTQAHGPLAHFCTSA